MPPPALLAGGFTGPLRCEKTHETEPFGNTAVDKKSTSVIITGRSPPGGSALCIVHPIPSAPGGSRAGEAPLRSLRRAMRIVVAVAFQATAFGRCQCRKGRRISGLR